MAITRYAGDRFVIGSSPDVEPTGVLDGAYLINTGNLSQKVLRNGTWTTLAGGGGGGSPGGDNTQVQFNNAGSFAGSTGLTFDGQRLYANNFQLSGILYDSNASVGEGGMVLANEGTTGVHWKNIESVLSGVGGSGVANYVARWSDEDTLTTGALVDNGTKVGIGTATPSQFLDILATQESDAGIRVTLNCDLDSQGPQLILNRAAQNGGIVDDGDVLGIIKFGGYDGNSVENSAKIEATVNGTPSNDNMPTDLSFYTASAGTALERMRIASDGKVGIGTNDPSFTLHANHTNGGAVGLTRTAGSTAGVLGNIWFGNIDVDTTIANIRGVQDGATDSAKLVFQTEVAGGSLTERMVIKSDGNVGIGTTNPGGKLESYITSGGEKGLRLNSNFGGGNTVDFIPAIVGVSNAGFSIDLAGTNRLVINSDGKVGIGTNAPAQVLHVAGGNLSTIRNNMFGITSNTPGAGAESNAYHNAYYDTTNSREEYLVADEACKIQFINGQINFRTAAAGSADGAITWINAMGILADGKVGIGTAAPWTRFTIAGGTTAEADDFIPMSVSPSVAGGNSAGVLFGVYPVWGYAKQGIFWERYVGNGGYGGRGKLHFVNRDAVDTSVPTIADAKMTILEDGNVGIGTTSPSTLLHIDDDTTAAGLTIKGAGPGYVNAAIVLKATNSTSYRGLGVFMHDAGGDTEWYAGTPYAAADQYMIARKASQASPDYGTAVTGNALFTVKNDGKVGIGTTTPDAELQVMNNDSSSYRFGYGGTSDVYFDADDVYFRSDNGGANQITKKGGSLGIGVVNAEHKLHVAGDAIISGYLYDSTNSTGVDGYVLTSREDGPQWDYIEDILSGVGGNGTANYVPKWEDSDTIKNSIIYDDGTNVGISTVTPSGKFHVYGGAGRFDITNAATKDHHLTVSEGNATDWRPYAGNTTAALQLQSLEDLTGDARGILLAVKSEGNPELTTSEGLDINVNATVGTNNGTLAVKVQSDGKVGIGTNAPTKFLHVRAPASSTGGVIALLQSHDTANGWLQIQGNAGNSWEIGATDSGFQFYDDETASYKVTIKNNGNVGIGTTAPVQQLHVLGNAIRFERTDNAVALQLYNNNASPADDAALGYLQFMGKDNDGTPSMVYSEVRGGVQSNTNSAVSGYLSFLTTNNGTAVTEHMRIKADGNVGIGTASPGSILEVRGATETIPNLGTYGTFFNLRRTDGHIGLSIGIDSSTNNFWFQGQNSTSPIAQDLILNPKGGSIGIGEATTPDSTLQVIGPNAVGKFFQAQNQGAAGVEFKRVNAGSAPYNHYLFHNGFVGIGTTAPTDPLQIVKTVAGAESRVLALSNYGTTDNTATRLTFEGHSSTGVPKTQATIVATTVDSNNLSFTSKLSFTTRTADALVIFTDGNVGIGTNAAAALLQVETDQIIKGGTVRDGSWHRGLEITTENANYASLFFGNQQTTKYSGIVWTSSTSGNTGNKRGAQIYAHPTSATNTNLAFDTNNIVGSSSPTTKMTILGDGNVGIGITAPGYKTKIVSPSLTWGTSINDDTAALSVVKGYQDGANDSDVNVARFASVRASYGATADWAGHISLFTNSSVTDGSEGTERARITWDGNNRVYFGRSTDKVLTVQTAGGNYVGIGIDEPEHHLHVSGDAIISGVLYDSTNSSGVLGEVLTSEVGGPQWKMIEDVLSGVGGNGTAEYIPRWTDSDTIGDSVISQSGSNIGINMTAANPATELHIGSLAAPAQGENWASLSIGEDDYPERRTQINAYRSLRGADWDHMGISFQPHTSSSHLDGPTITGMVIDYDGHVGIGTNSPSVGLQVGNSVLNETKLVVFNSEGGVPAGLQVKARTNRAKIHVADNDSNAYVIAEGLRAFFGATSSGTSTNIAVQTDGNVGIGTTDPSVLLDVYQATVADSAQTLLKVRGTNDAQLRVEGANDNTSVGYGTNRSGGALILRNTNSTVGNYESICFSNANNYINAGIHGINVAHGEGNATRGKIEIWTRNTANNYHKALEISDSSAVTFHTSTGAVAYTLPNSDGNAGYHLETNGSGTVTWAAGGAGTVTSITAGDGLSGGTITTSGTIANTDKGSSQNIFKKVRTSNSVGNQLGLSTANSNDDTIDFRQGTGITLATSGDVVTITATNTTAGTVTGTGTANSISKWTGTSSQGNSTISDNGSIVTVANDFHIYKVGADKQLWLSEGTSGSGATNVQLNPNGVSYLRGGSVGIGTSIPGYRLEVKESSATWLSRIYNTGTGNGLLVRVDSGSSDAIFSTHNGTAHLLVVKGDGNVGIGTYTPTTLFESNVNSASVGTDSVTARNSGVTTIGHSVGYRYQFNTAVPAASRAILEHTNSGRSRLGFFVSTDGAVGNLTEYLSIKSDGVVDINSAKLKINGGSGTDGQVLTTDGAGGIAWETNANGTVTSITAGSGLSGGTITTSGTIANTDKGSSQNIFKKVRTSNSVGTQLGLSTANSNDDTIDFRQGTGITLATSGDVVTITATNTTVGTVTSSGTAGYIPRLSTSTNIANSIIYEETGKILLNGTTALGPFGHWSWTPTFQQLGTQGIASVRCAADVYGGALQLVSARGSNASPTIVLDNDRAGGVYFHAYDGVDFKNSAGAIECFIDGTPGADDTPGRLVFSTTPDGSNGFAEQMRIQSDGNVGIGTDAPAAWLQIKKDSNNSGNQFSVADTEGASAAVRTYTHGGDPSALILNHYYAVGGSSNEYMRYADIVANVSNGAGTTIRFITKNAANAYSATVIDNEGNVEIGATQAYKFTGSTAKISQQNNNDLNLYASDDINIKTRYARFYNGSTEHARIAINGSWVTGHFYPIANGTQDLGKTDKRWNNVYSEAGNFSGRVIAGDFEMLDLGGTGRTLAVRDGASNTVKIGDGVNFVTFRFNATQVAPNNNNNCILGASSLRWSTIYGVLGNFSGAVTWSGGGSANANTAYTYSQVGHLPLAGGTLTGLLTSRAITPSADSTYNLGENTVRYANIFGDTAYLGNADGTGLLLGVAAFGGATNQRLQIGATLAGSSSATAQIAGLTRVGYIITHNTSEGIRPNADGQSTCGTSVQRWSTVYGQAANFNGALTAGSGTFAGSVTPSVDSTYDLGENTNRWTNIFGDNIYGGGANLTSLNASALGSGTVPTARLGTGTADSSTFLRGDNTWVANAGGTVTSVTAGTGMTQSGTSTINPTLNVIGGTGITANANDIAITNTAVSAGSYTYASITVDAQGRLTAASSGSAPGGGTVTGTGTDNYVPRWNGTTALQNSALFSDDNDNVGIGTTTPNTHGWADKALTIYDSSGTNKYTAVEILGKGTGGGAVLFGNQTLLRASIYGGNGSYLSFSTNSNNSGTTMVEKMRILSDGNVGIGTNNPSKLLDVNGTSYFRDDIYFGNTVLNPASGFSNQTGMGWDKSTGELQIASSTTVLELGRHSSTGTIFSCRYGSMQKASIDTSGNMSLAGTLSESSSIAIKENVETYSPSLENISKMRPVRFNKKKSKKKEVGLVAEELAEMFPELVETDKDGKPSGVNYSRAVAVLLHGFKELYKEVKELKEKI